MVKPRLAYNSGDKEDKPPIEVILNEDDLVFLHPDKSGAQPEKCKDGANAVILPLLIDVQPNPYGQCVVEEAPKEEGQELDPWDLPELQDNSPSWSELSHGGRVRRVVLGWVGKPVALLLLLYFFICSLDVLSSAFRLLGGKAVGEVFASSELLRNPVAGLMIGILATVTVQSSSTSTSIVITMVAAGILPVSVAIPIIMGANIGTSVTNTIVSMTESGDRNMFRLAFAGATVHDMFNWLAVLVLLPLECATGYLFHLTTALVKVSNLQSNKDAKRDFLKKLTKPFTKMVIQLDKKIIEKIALGQEEYMDHSLVKRCDEYELHTASATNLTRHNETSVGAEPNISNTEIVTASEKCPWFLLQSVPLSDTWLGLILLLASLVVLCTCLVLLVKILKSVLRGKIVSVVKKVVNADFCGAGYVGLLVGAIMTMLVQSSSIFTSVLTPLVGMNVIKLECMYPLTLGSNIGTTGTGLLAAMAADGDKLESALQIALVHLFFNISGILLFYPIPRSRLPIKLAKIMGNTTAKYRWFAGLYLVMMFLVLPGAVFSLSLTGTIPFAIILSLVMTTATAVIIINVLQNKIPHRLPEKMRTWEFLPFEWMHSLEPLDRLFMRIWGLFKRCCPCCPCCKNNPKQKEKTQTIAIIEESQPLNCSNSGSQIYIPSTESITSEQSSTDIKSHNLLNKQQTELAQYLERKLAQDWDVESGYGSREASRMASRIVTPCNTPCDSAVASPAASVMPSRVSSLTNLKESKL